MRDKSLYDQSFKGISFGVVSGVITTLGLMIGLDAGTSSKITVILGVLIIAISDALSDSLGVHVSEESEKSSDRLIWRATIATFLSKFLFGISFLIPLIFFELNEAIKISLVYGLMLIIGISYLIAEKQKKSKLHAIVEHLLITIVVITLTYYIGFWFSQI